MTLSQACSCLNEVGDAIIHPTPARRRFGKFLVAFGVLLSLGGAFRAYLLSVDQQQHMNEVQDRQAILYALMCNDVYPTVVLNKQGDIVEWNDAMEKLTGLSAENAKKQGLKAIMCDPVKAHAHDEGLKKVFADQSRYGKLIVVNCDIIDAHKKRVPVRVAIRVMPISDNKAYAIAKVDRESDIMDVGVNQTQEKKIEKEVERRTSL